MTVQVGGGFMVDKNRIDADASASTAFMDSVQRMKSARENKKEKYLIKEQGVAPTKAHRMAKENTPMMPPSLKKSNLSKYLTKQVLIKLNVLGQKID